MWEVEFVNTEEVVRWLQIQVEVLGVPKFIEREYQQLFG